jgi:uncharacterized membrane protein YeaQ/YmgE (transglycosylase-associated protein family)
MLQTIINLISGLAGGNIAAATAKQYNPGIIISSISGLAGGGLGGLLIHSLMNSGGKMDAVSIISGIVGSGAGAALLTMIVGFVRSKMTAK